MGRRRSRRVALRIMLPLWSKSFARLGVRVKITHDARGRGKVVIAFGSHEEFDQIRQHICGGGRAVRKGQAG